MERADSGNATLIACPACAHPVSDQAELCPSCGHAVAAPQKSSATTALVLGVLGLIPVWGLLFAPFAWWLGRREIRGIDVGLRRAAGRVRARVGQVLGIIGTAVWGLLLALSVVGFLIGVEDSTLLDEDFSSEVPVFSTDSDRFVDLVVEDGEYLVRIKDASVPQTIRHLFVRTYDGVRFEATIAPAADDSAALSSVSCWAGDSGYIFYLNSAGAAGLVEVVSESIGSRRPLSDLIETDTADPGAGAGPNRLRIDCVGGGTDPTVVTGWLNGQAVVSVAVSGGYDSFNGVGFWLASSQPTQFSIDDVIAVSERPDPVVEPRVFAGDLGPVPSSTDSGSKRASESVSFESDGIQFAYPGLWRKVAVDDESPDGVAWYIVAPIAPLTIDRVSIVAAEGTPSDDGLTEEAAARLLFQEVADGLGGRPPVGSARITVGDLPAITVDLGGIPGVGRGDERSARVVLVFGDSSTYLFVAQYSTAWEHEMLEGLEVVLSTFSEQQ